MTLVATPTDSRFLAGPLAMPVDQARVVDGLRDPAAFGPDCRAVELVETHISYVFLTGSYAYKIKKAVRLPFLDFTTLASRRHYCELELVLNRRTAPSLYLDVVPIVRSNGRFVAGAPGEAVEWAVRMQQFPQQALLSCMIESNELCAEHVDALAERIAVFHESIAEPRPSGDVGTPAEALHLALDNFDQLGGLVEGPAERARIDGLRSWTLREHALREPLMNERLRAGLVRACHGDLHLGNVALLDGVPTLFDCIEFDPRLRWGDVIADVAFTAMDLRARGRPDFARRLVNRYLETTGDYGGLGVLRFHSVYRAMVRAKVAYLRAAQVIASTEADRYRQAATAYVELAEQLTRPGPRTLVAMHGLSGCGKTTLSQRLVEQADIVRIRMDVERKRLGGLAATARSGSRIDEGLYAPDMSRAAYHYVAALTEAALRAGHAIVVDAALLKRWQRDLFRLAAQRCDASFVVVDLGADEKVLRERISARSTAGRDASEAGIDVLERQLATQEPLESDERMAVVFFATDIEVTLASDRWHALVASLGAHPAAAAPDRLPQCAAAPSIAEKVAFLSRPSSYSPPASRVDVVETHLSWVFLTERHAYKLKKPVRLDGLDYRTLEARYRNAIEEIRLNRRLAPSVYQPATRLVARADGSLALEGEGQTVDWLVKMRRLPSDRMLDALIRTRNVRTTDIEAIVATLVGLYRQAAVPSLSAGEYRRRLQQTIGTTHDALSRPAYDLPRDDVDAIAASQQRYVDRERDLLGARVDRGAIVEGHGDLRPEHVCLEAAPQIIDCLEFSYELRVQDTADELAFLALECGRLGAPELGRTIFAAYAALADDPVPETLVDFYQSFRAYLRARIAARHLDDAELRDPKRWRTQAIDYLRLARAHIARCA